MANVIREPGAWGVVISSTVSRIQDNRLVDNVLLGGSGGVFQRADANLTVERMTMVDNRAWFCWSTNPNTDPKDGDFAVGARLANTIMTGCPVGLNVTANPYQGVFDNAYNDLYAVSELYNGLATAGVGEVSVDAAFDVNQFGPGAYLRGPTPLTTAGNGAPMGARVMYRSTDGVLDDTPLWPWPMESRIRRETGLSVTWEDAGGLWRTLCGAYD
jgi:hypothetical protein